MTSLDTLLERTSRTFALSIPRLPEPSRLAVTLAYLLFRSAASPEDSSCWPRAARLEALDAFQRLLESDPPSPEAARALARQWEAAPPCEHAGYRELLRETPYVIERLADLDPALRAQALFHTRRPAGGMAGFIARGRPDGSLALDTLDDLRRYCYTVAGIVGEMLTEIFLLGAPQLADAAEALRTRSAAFGEGLQLVNILRDRAGDAAEGRVYLPAGVDRAEVFALARADLGEAAVYVNTLQARGAPRGFVEFTGLPVRLAFATLDKVEREGPGAKVSRLEVLRLIASLELALTRGAPAIPPPQSR